MSGKVKLPFAEVIVDIHAREVDRPFHYRIPEAFAGQVHVGTRVIVPFGPRRLEGYVIGFSSEPEPDVKNIKEILDVLDEQPPLTEELVKLADWMSYRYLSSKAASVQALFPAGVRARTSVRLTLKEDVWNKLRKSGSVGISPKEQQILDLLAEGAPVYKDKLLKDAPGLKAPLQRLLRLGTVEEKHEVSQAVQTLYITAVSCTLREADFQKAMDEIPARAFKQKEVARWIRMHGPSIPVRDVLRATHTTYSTINSLVRKGILVLSQVEERRNPYANRFTGERERPLALTGEQEQAYRLIASAMAAGRPDRILLQGVTGSGKTEIYLQSIAACMAQGRKAIVLVPEISLTPQMVERFKRRFGDDVAVLHSRLSQGERYDEWKRIRRGTASIVVGARSAVFAPLENLGLIVIDEEHELSYKQEEQPKYHAREVAWQRALHHGAVLVLGSATPSLETRFMIERGEGRRILLPTRFNKKSLPTVRVIDMRQELQAGNRSMFSRPLHHLILDRLAKQEQIILFLNRRGYSSFILCRNCGYVARCPDCDISLTYHKAHGFEVLRCHYCGHSEPSVSQCPSCSSPHIRTFGTGTQRVEEELNKVFPAARVIRMDVDTTGTKGSHERLLQQFRDGQADILLGTQMIAKGLDFPRVSLVGVITADTSLNLPDFRAAERTFQLLTQVAGRAGRHETEGVVLVQTYHPEHYAIQYAVTQDYEDFYRQEIEIRRTLDNPPLCDLAVFTAQHENRAAAERWVRSLEKRLRAEFHTASVAEVLPACPAPIPKLQGKHRYHLCVKVRDFAKAQPVLLAGYLESSRLAREQGGTITIDVNAQMIL
ncbi:primosomal protein N' [Effusibacillus lacus]|uniref:Replication restart protein PriA n=1 Tax=Effusibacillus lacus TaxID=1348429 RepID=A0A292YML7_9BACL|nr:primosomal protein N' [Effusibacillus lacus]TCS76554.1 replication restart DNA helicase PriA [Effusibacillus lacus]GAX90426.1 primosomal protein N' [Effusibacillus lacus]